MTPALIYSQLEALVLSVLREYQSDLTVQDRNCLSAYTGPFLLSYRHEPASRLVRQPRVPSGSFPSGIRAVYCPRLEGRGCRLRRR